MSRDDREQPDKIQAFDALFTTNHIQMYKILLPYLEASLQKQLAVYIKYMEFQYTLTYFKLHPKASMPRETQPDAAAMCGELAPFCSSSEKAQLEKMVELFSNIKNAKEIEGKKEIKIEIKQKDNKTIISVFNTGENIKEEDLERIWKRFYKVDESRNRQNGGTGIGLALVKAIMERTGKKYGVENKENGVEFYFEI